MKRRVKSLVLMSLSVATSLPANSGQKDAAEVIVEQTVELPPFMVRGDRITQWYYADLPGLEILSSCELKVTEGFVRRFLHAKAEFGELVTYRARS